MLTIGHVVEITVTTEIAATLSKGGRTVHSLLVLGKDDKDSAYGSSSRRPSYGPRSERTGILRRTSLIIIDESSMIKCRFFELINSVIQELRYGRLEETKNTQGRDFAVSILFCR